MTPFPNHSLRNMNNVALVVEPWNRDNPNTWACRWGSLSPGGRRRIAALPDKITIYKEAICAYAIRKRNSVRQVAVTVVHEIGHHFGIDDDRLHEPMGVGADLPARGPLRPGAMTTHAIAAQL